MSKTCPPAVAAIRPGPLFIADHRGLDFLNSVAVSMDVEVEWLASGEDLLTWLEQAGLASGDVSKRFCKSTPRRQLDAVAMRARSLRDWFRPFVYRHMGAPLERQALAELEPLNRMLACDEQIAQIVARDGPGPAGHGRGRQAKNPSALAWRLQRRWEKPETLLFPLARSLADLVCNEDLTHVRVCEGPACTLLFIDRTRGRLRRWCSMGVCGNRAKQAAHRARVRQERQG